MRILVVAIAVPILISSTHSLCRLQKPTRVNDGKFRNEKSLTDCPVTRAQVHDDAFTRRYFLFCSSFEHSSDHRHPHLLTKTFEHIAPQTLHTPNSLYISQSTTCHEPWLLHRCIRHQKQLIVTVPSAMSTSSVSQYKKLVFAATRTRSKTLGHSKFYTSSTLR